MCGIRQQSNVFSQLVWTFLPLGMAVLGYLLWLVSTTLCHGDLIKSNEKKDTIYMFLIVLEGTNTMNMAASLPLS